MAFIYKIENMRTHKVYIGKTLFGIDRRWTQHLRNLTDPTKNYLPLYVDMINYGVENFTITPIEEVNDDYKLLAEKEKYWIAFYNYADKGYNGTSGGDGHPIYDYDLIWELWEEGYKIKEISSQVGCLDQVVRTVLNLHAVPTEERIARSIDDQINSHKRFQREVNKIDINTGEIIETYDSVRGAARVNGIDNSDLSKICRNSGVANGYRWEYTGNQYEVKDYSPKMINQIDLETGAIVNTYPSISEAARAINGDTSYISKVCSGKQKSSKGYGCEYATV